MKVWTSDHCSQPSSLDGYAVVKHLKVNYSHKSEENLAWRVEAETYTGGNHERDLLVVKPIHVACFSLRPKGLQQEGKRE